MTFSPKRYKLVVKDKNGKVQQIHETYREYITQVLITELDKGFSVTVTELKG